MAQRESYVRSNLQTLVVPLTNALARVPIYDVYESTDAKVFLAISSTRF